MWCVCVVFVCVVVCFVGVVCVCCVCVVFSMVNLILPCHSCLGLPYVVVQSKNMTVTQIFFKGILNCINGCTKLSGDRMWGMTSINHTIAFFSYVGGSQKNIQLLYYIVVIIILSSVRSLIPTSHLPIFSLASLSVSFQASLPYTLS